MKIIEVNQQTCTKCGICAESCLRELIHFQTGQFPKPRDITEALCIKCGHCVSVCPFGSLTHRNIPVERCLPIQNGLDVTAEQCEQLLKTRRSIRLYQDKAVPRDIIVKLIDVARYAPSGRNSQPVEWLIIDNKDTLKHIKEVGQEWMQWAIEYSPETTASLDLKRLLAYLERGRDVILRNAPVLIITHASKGDIMASQACTIALTYLELAAKNLGLGSCWAGLIQISANFPRMSETLTVPEGHSVCGSMLLGHPKYRYHRIPLRNSPRITWHQ